MRNGYEFYFKDGKDLLTFPITPSELSITVGSQNKVVTLISEGEINILKSPSLVEVEFEARFPMRQYPYARKFSNFESYWNKFKELKEKKKSFRFVVARTTPNGSATWDTNLLMALEDVKLYESADEGDDVLVSFCLKQYKEYGVKTIQLPETTPPTTSTSETSRPTDNETQEPQKYTIKSGDTLWGIAKQFYGDGSKYSIIYNANTTVIEDAARRYGKSSSSNGHWIYPGTELIIPGVESTATSNGGNNYNGSTNPSVNDSVTPTQFSIKVRTVGDASAKGAVVIDYTENRTVKRYKWDGWKAHVFKADKGTVFRVTVSPQYGWEILHVSGDGFLACGANMWMVESVNKDCTLELKWAKK